MPSVLDLPTKRQKELAALEGKTLEQWARDKKIILDESRLYSKMLQENSGKRPEGWTEDDIERFQKKIDSSVPTKKDQLPTLQ